MTLVVTKGDTGEGVVEEIRDLIGPADVEKAKEEAPERFVIRECIITLYLGFKHV